MEAAADPWTVHNFLQLRVQPGWRCLEVGGGGGSIAEWLANQVGPNGRVIATDLETKFLEAIDADNIEVRKHDIVQDPLESDAYDLIHARAVLDHIPDRDLVVERLVTALKPGGWLTIEGGDFSTVRAVAGGNPDAFEMGFAKMLRVGESLGMESTYGRRLGEAFRHAGLVDVSSAGMVTEWGCGDALKLLYHMTFERLREPAIEAGVITGEALDRLLDQMAAPSFRAISHAMFFARGRRRA